MQQSASDAVLRGTCIRCRPLQDRQKKGNRQRCADGQPTARLLHSNTCWHHDQLTLHALMQYRRVVDKHYPRAAHIDCSGLPKKKEKNCLAPAPSTSTSTRKPAIKIVTWSCTHLSYFGIRDPRWLLPCFVRHRGFPLADSCRQIFLFSRPSPRPILFLFLTMTLQLCTSTRTLRRISCCRAGSIQPSF